MSLSVEWRIYSEAPWQQCLVEQPGNSSLNQGPPHPPAMCERSGLLRQCFQVKFSPKEETKEGGNFHFISCSAVGTTWTSRETRSTLCSPVKAKMGHRQRKSVWGKRQKGRQSDGWYSRGGSDGKGLLYIQVCDPGKSRHSTGAGASPPLPGHTVSYRRCRRVTQTQGRTSKPFALHLLKVRQPQTRREQILRGAMRGSQRSRFVCFIKKVLESSLSPSEKEREFHPTIAHWHQLYARCWTGSRDVGE